MFNSIPAIYSPLVTPAVVASSSIHPLQIGGYEKLAGCTALHLLVQLAGGAIVLALPYSYGQNYRKAR